MAGRGIHGQVDIIDSGFKVPPGFPEIQALRTAEGGFFRVIKPRRRGQGSHAEEAFQRILRRVCEAHSRDVRNVFFAAQGYTPVFIDTSFKNETMPCYLSAGIKLCISVLLPYVADTDDFNITQRLGYGAVKALAQVFLDIVDRDDDGNQRV